MTGSGCPSHVTVSCAIDLGVMSCDECGFNLVVTADDVPQRYGNRLQVTTGVGL